MFRNTFLTIFEDIWPMILICSVIIISMRLVYIIKNKVKIVFYKEILSLTFIIYIIALFRVVTFQDVSWSTSNFIPLKEIFRYEIGSQLFYKNVIGNMLMFIPYGFFTSYFLKLKKPSSIFLLTLLVSITIEFTQLLIGRVFDIDDIILNLIGGIIGFLLYYLITNIKYKLPSLLQKDITYNIIIVVLFIIISLYLGGIYV